MGAALRMSAGMAWVMLWPLTLGFFISACIQAVVSHKDMARLLPDAGPASLARAVALGAASSSCSYAAAAIARAMIRRGGNFTAAMAFQFASTNLVVELGLTLWLLLGWRFTLASWAGGLVLILLLVPLLRLCFRGTVLREARTQAAENRRGRMEGHAAMDMAVTGGPVWRRLASPAGFTAVAHYFWMDWASLWLDLLAGILVAGALAAWVPAGFWAQAFGMFGKQASWLAGPLIGPLLAVVTFVCSVGNVPLAAVLWRGGASFGGVLGFLFGDLIVLPVLDIYRRYYGLRPAAVLAGVSYAAMAAAALLTDLAFCALGLVPRRLAGGMRMDAAFGSVAGLVMNGLALVLGTVLLWRFLRTGGPAMLRHMK